MKLQTSRSEANLIDETGWSTVVALAREEKVEGNRVGGDHHGLHVGLRRSASGGVRAGGGAGSAADEGGLQVPGSARLTRE